MLESKERLRQSQAKELEKYLGVSGKPEDELATVHDVRMSGTCEWFTAKNSYQKWRDFSQNSPTVIWVNGKPAAGKSVLAGYVIDQLGELNGACSWFFFKHGDKSKSRLSNCLRSLAFQMACMDNSIREKILEMRNADITLDNGNEGMIWRKLFLSGIFQAKFRRHYWVIDALDECVDFSSFFGPMLAKLGEIPIRVLIMSRDTAELETHFSSLPIHRFWSENISIADTLPDVKSLILSKAKTFFVKGEDDRTSLVETILEKSQGSFLWTVLVLNHLSNSHGEKEISQVLSDVPQGMESLYERTLEIMSRATHEKILAKAILTWTTCATRPLTTKELEGALKLDVKDNFPNLRESILALCGQLVTVGKLGKVQMVHETAREFLLNENLESEFAINKLEAHTRIARTCLMYLTADDMKPARTSRCGSITPKRAEFSLYACTEMSYHLAKSDTSTKDILELLERFLKSNVLSWVEVIAETQNLTPLIDAGRNLRMYLNSCTAEQSPHHQEIQAIRDWTIDLIRMTAKFADSLVTSPAAIYSLIPPLCPTESMIYKTPNRGRRLSLLGLSTASWGDRLSFMNFQNGRTNAVCYGDGFFAVGLTTGAISLYHATSFQEYLALDHGESVRFLEFNSKSYLLASCGARTVIVWDVRSGETIHSFEVLRPMGITFDKNLLIATSSKNHLLTWDLDKDGIQLPNRPWKDSIEQEDKPLRKMPAAVSISVSHQILAVAYIRQPITLWDLERDTYYGNCGKRLRSGKTSTDPVSALVINPNPDISLLAITYHDGEPVLLNPFNDQHLGGFRANCHTLAASPDGRLLAGSAGSGIIKIFEFETLKLLYQVKSSDMYIKQLAFSRDSLHLADIRGSQCNVWDPGFLLGNFGGDNSSGTTSTAVVADVNQAAPNTTVKISSMILHPKGGFFFCGKGDGSISLYDLKTGFMTQSLYRHKCSVHILAYWPGCDTIMSVDLSNKILAVKLKSSLTTGWVVEKELFQSQLNCGMTVTQILPGEAAGRFIVSTRRSAYLWSADGQLLETRTYPGSPRIRKWTEHPQSTLHMICIDATEARIYAWDDLSEVASVSLSFDMTELEVKSVVPYKSSTKSWIIIELSELDGPNNTRAVHLLDAEPFYLKSPSFSDGASDVAITEKIKAEPLDVIGTASIPFFGPQFSALSRHIVHVTGLSDTNKFLFLDTRSWVCSIDLRTLDSHQASYWRHFFIPYDWFAGILRDIICTVSLQNILFAVSGEVAIVKGGLEYAEKVNVEVGTDGTNGSLTIQEKRRIQNKAPRC